MLKKISELINGRPYVLEVDGRKFNCYVSSVGSSLCEVSFYEVVKHQNGKEREKFFPLDKRIFWIDDFDTINEGVKHKLAISLQEEAQEIERSEKIKNFKKSY